MSGTGDAVVLMSKVSSRPLAFIMEAYALSTGQLDVIVSVPKVAFKPDG